LISLRAFSALLISSTPASALPTSTHDARCPVHNILLDSSTVVVVQVLEFRNNS
jgi:hypothetical protein